MPTVAITEQIFEIGDFDYKYTSYFGMLHSIKMRPHGTTEWHTPLELLEQKLIADVIHDSIVEHGSSYSS